MKKKLILMGIAGALVVTTIIGGSLAMIRTSLNKQATSDITTKNLAIGIYEDNKEAVSGPILLTAKVPGESVSKNLVVKNTLSADVGYDTYVRVTIYKAWGKMSNSEKGVSVSNISGNFVKDSSLDQLDQIILGLGTSPKWRSVSSTNEETVLYYLVPLKPGESTESFLNSIKIGEKVDNAYAEKSILLDIDVDAVQAADGVDAISSAWGVSVSLNSIGEITNITD